MPDDRRLAEVGWTRTELGTVIRTLGDGTWLGEYFDGDQRMDIILRGERLEHAGGAGAGRRWRRRGAGVLPLGELARLETLTSAPQLRRVDRRRTVTLTVDPPATLSLEEALAAVQDEILPALRSELPADASVQVAGSADQLAAGGRHAWARNFVLALLVLFLLMAAMFKSLRDASLRDADAAAGAARRRAGAARARACSRSSRWTCCR